MPRTISQQGVREMLSETSDNALLTLIEITHPTIQTPWRFINNTQNLLDYPVTGDIWLRCPFSYTMAKDTDETVPTAKIILENVSQSVIRDIRTLTTPPTAIINIIRIDNAGTITLEQGPISFLQNKFDYNMVTMEIELGFEADFLNEPAVKDRFSPAVSPGIF